MQTRRRLRASTKKINRNNGQTFTIVKFAQCYLSAYSDNFQLPIRNIM